MMPKAEIKACPPAWAVWAAWVAVTMAAAALLGACSDKPGLEKRGGSSRQVSLAYLKTLYDDRPTRIDDNIYIEGMIVSSDRRGNFYKTLVLEDETGGISVRVDKTNIWQDYPMGKKLNVRCNSLMLGSYGGKIELGAASSDGVYEISPIDGERFAGIASLSPEPEVAPSPTEIAISGLSARYIDCLVCFTGVQFAASETGRKWCDTDLDTDRTIIAADGNTLVVRTSSYATFARYTLPDGNGMIIGVMGYFNGNYQLVMIKSQDAIMNGARF